MRRTMGMFLVLLAELFNRPKPRYQQRFEKILDKHGTQVLVLALTETGSGDQVHYLKFSAIAYVENPRIDEEVVKSGQFTT